MVKLLISPLRKTFYCGDDGVLIRTQCMYIFNIYIGTYNLRGGINIVFNIFLYFILYYRLSF